MEKTAIEEGREARNSNESSIKYKLDDFQSKLIDIITRFPAEKWIIALIEFSLNSNTCYLFLIHLRGYFRPPKNRILL